jgi:hypothetical protein
LFPPFNHRGGGDRGADGSAATVHVGREPKAALVTAKCYGGDATRKRKLLEQTLPRGRPQRESIAIALKELGFTERLPQIREDSRNYLLSSRKKLLAERPAPKMTRQEALAWRDEFRSRSKGGRWIDPEKFTLKNEPEPVPVDEGPFGWGTYFQKISVWGEGSGVDLRSLLTAVFFGPLAAGAIPDIISDPLVQQAAGTFYFYPGASGGTFEFSTGVLCWGNYILNSDDGLIDSKEAQVDVRAIFGGGYAPENSDPWDNPGQLTPFDAQPLQLFEKDGANINETDGFASGDRLSIIADVPPGMSAFLAVTFIATVAARGDGSFAELDMTEFIGGMMTTGVATQQIA